MPQQLPPVLGTEILDPAPQFRPFSHFEALRLKRACAAGEHLYDVAVKYMRSGASVYYEQSNETT